LTLQRIGRSAYECLMIDDTEANIVTAKKLGFVTIHFNSPEQLRMDLHHLNLL
jgi:2-haloacid dehalogenase